MDDFVSARIEEGKYANASEVLRAGLRALQLQEEEDQAKLLWLRNAIQEAENSPESEDVDGEIAIASAKEYLHDLAKLQAKHGMVR